MGSDCCLEMNHPFASLNLGRAGCFGRFGLSGWILMKRPVFGSLDGMHCVGFCGCGICSLTLSTIAIFGFPSFIL